VLTIRAIYRLRAYLGAAIERWGEASGPGLARYLPWHAFSSVGHHMLAVWVALVYLAWAVGSSGAALLLTQGLLATLLALIAVRAVNIWLDWTVVRRPLSGSTAGDEGTAELEPLPTAQVLGITAIRVGVMVLGLLVIVQAWGVDVYGWIAAGNGRAVLATMGRIVFIIAVAGSAGQLIQRGAGRYIAAQDANGNPLYSNRTRTLVSMARNLAVTMLVAIGIVEVLSELGVNANALLAGAGVVGLAIGFGAQTLVKDLITGLFILAGDTVRVGDVVDLGGKAGVVEAISMRTITLRAYNGDVHTIPFSSIDVVTNMTKDFSYYVFDVIVAYKENVDRVVEVLREIDSQLRREWPYRRLMLEPLEIAGVDAFRDSGVLIKARTRVRPGEQWKVGREFNRRIKRRFDELGIELPVPQQKVVFAGSTAEDAPPSYLEPLRKAAGEA
jgi:moderate conductance mechanosensitive channel